MDSVVLRRFGFQAAKRREQTEAGLKITAMACSNRSKANGTALCDVCKARKYCR